MKIIISRTDKIGDVILTLPLAGIIKSNFPNSFIYFLGSSYTRDIALKSAHIDRFLSWDHIKESKLPEADVILHVFPNKKVAKMARQAGIPTRVGTSHRIYHLWTCNKLVNFTRKNSNLHEAQLNTLLLKPLNIDIKYSIDQLNQLIGWKRSGQEVATGLLTKKINIVLHTKSKGSALEWPLRKYHELIAFLPRSRFHFFLSGTKDEGQLIHSEFPAITQADNVTDITGKFSLEEFISFIEYCDGLLACSTGPLHIASAANIQCLGLYPSIRPMHSGRWGPIGKRSLFIEDHESSLVEDLNIPVAEVVDVIRSWKKLSSK